MMFDDDGGGGAVYQQCASKYFCQASWPLWTLLVGH